VTAEEKKRLQRLTFKAAVSRCRAVSRIAIGRRREPTAPTETPRGFDDVMFGPVVHPLTMLRLFHLASSLNSIPRLLFTRAENLPPQVASPGVSQCSVDKEHVIREKHAYCTPGHGHVRSRASTQGMAQSRLRMWESSTRAARQASICLTWKK
jgi:hypothetical protein